MYTPIRIISIVFLGQGLAAVLALVIIKVYGHYQKESERQEQEKQKKVYRVVEEA